MGTDNICPIYLGNTQSPNSTINTLRGKSDGIHLCIVLVPSAALTLGSNSSKLGTGAHVTSVFHPGTLHSSLGLLLAATIDPGLCFLGSWIPIVPQPYQEAERQNHKGRRTFMQDNTSAVPGLTYHSLACKPQGRMQSTRRKTSFETTPWPTDNYQTLAPPRRKLLPMCSEHWMKAHLRPVT